MERAVKKMLATHRARDAASADADEGGPNTQRIERLQHEAQRIRDFLARNTERRSAKGAIRKSNVTDNDNDNDNDSARGRRLYGQRMATVEPVFANLRHNIEKLARSGFAR